VWLDTDISEKYAASNIIAEVPSYNNGGHETQGKEVKKGTQS
jgi:hypothetical protein